MERYQSLFEGKYNFPITVYQDGELVYAESAEMFLKDNDYDDIVVAMVDQAKRKGYSTYDDYHAGKWEVYYGIKIK